MTSNPETEFKLRATRPLEVATVDAALRELGVQCRESSTSSHTDTYLDDEFSTLATAGIGLRLRVGGAGSRIACKARCAGDNGLFVREEHEAVWPDATPPASARELPDPLRDRIEPFVLDRPLVPTMQLAVRRDARVVVADDRDLCELAIDRVEASAAGRTAAFEEVEVEVVDDVAANERLAQALQQRLPLQAAADDKPGHAAVLLCLPPGPRATATIDAGTTVADAVGGLAERHLDAIRRAEVGVREDHDPERLHEMRVAVRRLRSVVRAFRDLWPHEVATSLLERLADIGRRLGPVRDLDVMLAMLPNECAELPAPLHAAADHTIAWIRSERAKAGATLQEWLRSAERLRQQDELQDTIRSIDRAAAAAAVPLAAGVGTRIAQAAERLRKAIAGIPPDLPLEPLHALRISSKRLRYLAEEFAQLPGHDYGKSLARVTVLQQALGAVCDHEFACQRLLDWIGPAVAAAADGPLAAAALGGLAARHAVAATKARKRVRQALARVDRKRAWRRWLGEDQPDANLAT